MIEADPSACLATSPGPEVRRVSSMELIGPELQRFEKLLSSGGDERIAIDAAAGRNRYGTPRGMASGETWFSSSTASAISARGYAGAAQAYCSIDGGRHPRALPAWFDSIRSRLAGLFGVAGSEIVLSASGTELELIALFLAQSIFRWPLTNLVVAPTETGSGVLLAASGRHFLGSSPFDPGAVRGAPINGMEIPETLVDTIDIRDQSGSARSSDHIDEEIVQKVEAGIADDRCVLVHLLDCSKTNLGGLRRSTAARLVERYHGRVLVVVDCCQLRCSPAQIQADLRAGFMVMISGSKFAAGPPFAGAMLLPWQIVDQLGVLSLPPGLLGYAAADDWPVALHNKIDRQFAISRNMGTGLRWEAALAELERLFALPAQFREAVATVFSSAVEQRVRENSRLRLVDREPSNGLPTSRTIFPIVSAAHDGTPVASDAIHRALRLPLSSGVAPQASTRAFHVGQPVSVGNQSALRVCLSASHIVDVADNMAGQKVLEAAFVPLQSDLDNLFLKWARVTDDICQS